ncbi:ABC transporter substrate-binding protein [Pseudoalteromonas spongiae]|uniref:ABC transporter substrate-binding protein n=1 Tax=Pseudoalteromonas spongiae TaxID=298657 RepID=UPI0020182B02|nr:ABC transporter substrate-binding protein [Pseudoalteromonas spongiae]
MAYSIVNNELLNFKGLKILNRMVLSFIFVLVTFYSVDLYADKSIHIPLNKWSSQRVLSKAVGKVISDSGTPVEYVEINVEDQWGALRRGAIHFQLEVWEPSMKKAFNHLVAQNEIIDLGTHKATVIEDWWYPEYVEKYCPSLPVWTSLNECIDLFKEKPSDNKGVYHGGPWNYGDADIIRALNINFEINRLQTGLELWHELAKAIHKEKPIVLLNWSPNWTDKYSHGKFIQFPEYEEECEINPEWGLNKKYVKDCANRKNGWLKKAASKSLKENYHCIFQFIKQVNFSKEMIIEASSLVVINKLNLEEAAERWIASNSSAIEAWRLNTCM